MHVDDLSYVPFRHEERQSLPMDYDIATCGKKDKNLLKSAYNRIGTSTDGVRGVMISTRGPLAEARSHYTANYFSSKSVKFEMARMNTDCRFKTDTFYGRLYPEQLQLPVSISLQSMKDLKTTTHEAQEEAEELKDTYRVQDVHKTLMNYDNFIEVPFQQRDTKRPERGYGSVLPRHPQDYRKCSWNTTTNLAFQYPFEWTAAPPTVSFSAIF